jgi:mono/diheme cytochrome c family protein
MNYRFLCTISFIIIFFAGTAAQKKFEFTYPDEATTDSSKKVFAKQFKQGQVLYQVVCASCHKITEGRKEIIPDFSLPQLMDYEIRIYPQHQADLNDTKLTHEELDAIVSFLRYKERSGRTVVHRNQ